MIDISKLKYYETLREIGVFEEKQNDIDSIINMLEEKQFEYLKRFETAKDDTRKAEIKELLDMIDEQLKQLSGIKSAIDAGIITENITRESEAISLDIQGKHDKYQNKTSEQKNKKSKRRWIIVSLIAALLVGAFGIIVSQKDDEQQTSKTIEKSVNTKKNTDAENDSVPKIGVAQIEGPFLQKQMEDQDVFLDDFKLFEGLYIYDIANQTLIDGGLQLGDRIISLNGERITSDSDLTRVRDKYKAGDDCIFVVSRGQETATINGKFVRPSECLPYKTSGHAIIVLEGRPFRITYKGEEDIMLTVIE